MTFDYANRKHDPHNLHSHQQTVNLSDQHRKVDGGIDASNFEALPTPVSFHISWTV